MDYSPTIALECPHCRAKCQFFVVHEGGGKVCIRQCTSDSKFYIPYICTNCQGLIATKWRADSNCSPSSFRSNPAARGQSLEAYYPIVGDWKPRVRLDRITNDEVRADFEEAINCYNNGFYNACMVMSRRAIQQEVLKKEAKGNNLYQQIEATGISKKLKTLLHKVKNFGNHGAHPDFCLYDNEGNQITDKKEFAKLSLEFLDRYFADEYEIDSLIKDAPKSKKELNF